MFLGDICINTFSRASRCNPSDTKITRIIIINNIGFNYVCDMIFKMQIYHIDWEDND